MPTAGDLLNKLPDKEKAKIANTLLDDVRKRFGSERLGLAADDTPEQSCCRFLAGVVLLLINATAIRLRHRRTKRRSIRRLQS